MEVLVRSTRDINPFLLKIGAALALSAGGYLSSHLRRRYRERQISGTKAEDGVKGLKDVVCVLISEEPLAKILDGTSTTTTTTITTTTTFFGLSATGRRHCDEERPLPEQNGVVRSDSKTGRDADGIAASPTLKRLESREEAAMGQEIIHLKNLVGYLRERESNLELQLLEYYGLQEQEHTIKELENQLKISRMEADIFCLKIESLQADNQRLHAQLLDCSKAMIELDAARAKIKSLKRKLKLDGEEAKEDINLLHKRISALQNWEEIDRKDTLDAARKLKKLKELECEVLNLNMLNSELLQENFELIYMSEASPRQGPEVEALEEAKLLREANEKLTKEIEQLQVDRCSDAEELVYLKWVNACLRYEVRNYQPPPGKTVARDLSKTLSPKSEEKAKQLIIEYANSGVDDKRLSPSSTYFGSEYCSSSRTSSGELNYNPNDASFRNNKTNVKKPKFFKKLKKLVLGKDSRHENFSSADRTPVSSIHLDRRESFSTYSADEMVGIESYDSLSSCMTEENFAASRFHGKPPQHHGRASLDLQRSQKLKLDEEMLGKGYKFKRIWSSNERSGVLSQTSSIDSEGTDSQERLELKKFAEALKTSP